MKTDLVTAIGLAIVGTIVSFLICNILVGSWTTGDYQIGAIESTVEAEVAEPDAGIFNSRALNPTVEVYVGDCDEDDDECEENESESEINPDVIPDSEENNPNSDENNSNESNSNSDENTPNPDNTNPNSGNE